METVESLKTHGHLIFGGTKYPVACPGGVLNWEQTGMKFEVGKGGRPRKEKIRSHVVHWTGGENPPKTLFRVLNSRGLGVEFAIDYTGQLIQFCDPLILDSFDAGYANPFSVGTEIVSRGFWPKHFDLGRTADRCRKRRTFEDVEIRGRKMKLALFTKAQLETLHILNLTLNAVLGIPLSFPRDSEGKPLSTTMTKRQVRESSGILGHFHISKRKTDPGLGVFNYLDRTGLYA